MEENVGVKDFIAILLDAGAEYLNLNTYSDSENHDAIVAYKFKGWERSESVAFKNNKVSAIDRDRVADVIKRLKAGEEEC